uniref:Uncharacterized protein n=1 Tax=Nelumbo nucifera TaxID=4432 RepID=A0A822YJJ4_NELNU|nr:TPA_asm: hypothetical protein HUJ06_011538 [Nelumbo nucifera]
MNSNKQYTTFTLPKEIYMVEDDDDNTTSQATTGEKKIPSTPIIEAEGNECEILTEKTIFDHIRRKAKNFPRLAASKTTSSTSETSVPTRKRSYDSGFQNATSVLGDKDRNKIPRQTVVLSELHPRNVEEKNYFIDIDGHGFISGGLSSFNVLKEHTLTGVNAPEIEENRPRTANEGTISADLKVNNFLTFDTPKDFEALIITVKQFCEEQPELHNATDMLEKAAPSNVLMGTWSTPDSEPRVMEEYINGTKGTAKSKQFIVSRSPSSRRRKLDPPAGVSKTNTKMVCSVMFPEKDFGLLVQGKTEFTSPPPREPPHNAPYHISTVYS